MAVDPQEEKDKWEAKKRFIEAVELGGDEALQREKYAALSFGAKLLYVVKQSFWNTLGMFISPFGWALTWGVEKLLDIAEADLIPAVKPMLDNAEKDPETPAEVKHLLKSMNRRKSFAFAPVLVAVGIAALISTIMSMLSPLFDRMAQESAKKARGGLLPEAIAIPAYFRDPSFQARARDILARTGYPEGDIDATITALRSLVDPSLLTQWKFRFEVPDNEYFDLMSKLGYEKDEAQRYLDASRYYPSPQDLVIWQAREVFEPEMITKYGLDDEFDKIEKTPFYKAGMDNEQIRNYWRAHWQHASWNQVVELLHRGQMEEADVRDWFRLVEIPPFWREKLINVSWNVPTRVDVRRFWDMRTIDEARLREVYTHQGYHDKDLDDYVLWTKVYVAFPDLMARFKNGWITQDDVKAELSTLGMPDDRIQEMIEAKIKTAAPERTLKERDVTKAEIVKGVKKDVITRIEANVLLQEMGYDQAEAAFILAINIPEDIVDTVVRQRDLTKTDVLKGLKVGLIDRNMALQMLLDLRYVQFDAEFLLSIFESVAAGEAPAAEREATKADIIKGVKKGLVAADQGYSMLLEIGYSHDAATFILSINVEAEPFSPHSYTEFLFLTRWYKSMLGTPAKIPPMELIQADTAYKQSKAAHATLLTAKASDNAIAEAAVALGEAEYRYLQLLILWNEPSTEGGTDS